MPFQQEKMARLQAELASLGPDDPNEIPRPGYARKRLRNLIHEVNRDMRRLEDFPEEERQRIEEKKAFREQMEQERKLEKEQVAEADVDMIGGAELEDSEEEYNPDDDSEDDFESVHCRLREIDQEILPE